MNIIRRKTFAHQEQDQVKAAFKKFKQQQQEAQWNFVNNPGLTPIPTPAPWIYSGFSETGTLAATTSVTALTTGTSMLAVGQVVTGTGIVNNPPTTIAVITSATAITLSQAASGSGAQTLTFQGVPGLQSPVFSNYPFFAVPSPTATDIPGQTFYIPEAQTLNAGSTFIPANGYGILALTSGTTAMTLQYLTAVGTWTSFVAGTASTTTYFHGIVMDGANMRINCPTTAGSFTFYRYRNPVTY